MERGRLVDAMADSQAHIHGKRFAIYGDPGLRLGHGRFLLEMGAEPAHVLATNGTKEWEKKVQALFDSSPFGARLQGLRAARTSGTCARCCSRSRSTS